MATKKISHWFPQEIICEILLKASVKSLLRCKSVCKEWYSLISDQHFIKSHYSLSCTNNIKYQLIYKTFEHLYDFKVCPLSNVLFDKCVSNSLLHENPLQLPQFPSIRIVGSCNGLLCLLVWNADYGIFIYNPTTRRSNLLPCSYQYGDSEVSYGFGYDELSNDYKVVITGIEPKMATIIYSSKTGKWKEIGNSPCARPLDDGTLLNRSLHWAAGKSNSSDSWKIFSLNLANETCGEILQPAYGKGYNYLKLGVLGERLCVLYNYYGSHVVDVWVIKVYGVKDSWTKLASISYPHHWRRNIWSPLCISEDGKLLLKAGLNLLVYDSKDISSFVIDNDCNAASIVVESLVSPFPPLGLTYINDNED